MLFLELVSAYTVLGIVAVVSIGWHCELWPSLKVWPLAVVLWPYLGLLVYLREVGGRMDGQMLYKVPVEEITRHLASRVTHHQKRAEEYAAQADAVEKSLAETLGAADTVSDRMDIKASNTYNNNVSQRDQLRAKVQAHAREAAFFQFALAHLPDPGEQRPMEMIRVGEVVTVGGHGKDVAGAYLLTRSALTELEFVPSGNRGF